MVVYFSCEKMQKTKRNSNLNKHTSHFDYIENNDTVYICGDGNINITNTARNSWKPIRASGFIFSNGSSIKESTQYLNLQFNSNNNNFVIGAIANDGTGIQLATTGTTIQLQKKTSSSGSWDVVWSK